MWPSICYSVHYVNILYRKLYRDLLSKCMLQTCGRMYDCVDSMSFNVLRYSTTIYVHLINLLFSCN